MSPMLDCIKGKRVLDLGCGTGSFFGNLLEKEPSLIDGYDVSESMIEKATAKAEVFMSEGEPYSHIPINTYAKGTDDIPDGSYDVVVCFQVLQNLCPNDYSQAKQVRKDFMTEIKRLLVPGGMTLISTRYRKQVDNNTCNSSYGDLYWYADPAIIPNAINHMEHAVPLNPDIELNEAGFQHCTLFNSKDTMIRPDAYLEGKLLYNTAYRAADSFFSRIDDSERIILLTNINTLNCYGLLEDYIIRRNSLRGDLGHVAVIIGYKPM